jgi:fused signal recognition particle receptor
MGIFTRFVAKVRGTSTASALDWEDLREELLAADLGPSLTERVIAEGQQIKGDDAQASLRKILAGCMTTKERGIAQSATTTVILVVGVNGVGKTTSVAKLAHHLQESGKSVMLGAADTFRAAAVDQLCTWGTRVGVAVITGKAESEPASVAFDAAKAAVAANVDYLIIDTAGRLHTKNDLMAELGKVRRVIEKVLPVAETILVLDGTTGQNALAQAELFNEAVSLTGLIVTKLDGSARGGAALAIENRLDLPIKFVGTGEDIGDFAAFESDLYLDSLIA